MSRSAAVAISMLACAACAPSSTTLTLHVSLEEGALAPKEIALSVFSPTGVARNPKTSEPLSDVVLSNADLVEPVRLSIAEALEVVDLRISLIATPSLAVDPVLRAAATVVPRRGRDARVDLVLSASVGDEDADRVPDLIDVCPRISDSSQARTDTVGGGDACFGLFAIHPTHATVGDVISLEGYFGTGPATVTFAGGQTVPVPEHGPERLFVSIPAGATSGPVTASVGTRTTPSVALELVPRTTLDALASNDQPALAAPRLGVGALYTGKYLYVVGGTTSIDDEAGMLTTIERAALGSDGVLGPFETAPGVTLNEPRAKFQFVRLADTFYAIGGVRYRGTTAANNLILEPLASVESAQILPDGTLSSFVARPELNLSIGRGFGAAVVIGSSLYVFGGDLIGGGSPFVDRAVLRADGSFDRFVVDAMAGPPAALSAAIVAGERVHVAVSFPFGEPPMVRELASYLIDDVGEFDFDVDKILVADLPDVSVDLGIAVGLRVGARMFIYGPRISAPAAPVLLQSDLASDGRILSVFSPSAITLPPIAQFFATSLLAGNSLFVIGGLGSTAVTRGRF